MLRMLYLVIFQRIYMECLHMYMEFLHMYMEFLHMYMEFLHKYFNNNKNIKSAVSLNIC